MESQKRSVVVGRVGTSGYVRWLPIICFASCLHAESGKVLERRPAVFHKYREVQGIDKYATEAEYRAVVNDTSFVLERVEYTSDDIAVVAYLYRPQLKPESAMPAIIFNRGGFRDTDVSLYLPSFHRFAKAGFVVLAPMLRQSEGASGIDELGGRDVHDVLSIVSLLSSFEFIDRNNLFLAGESRGGMMVLQALRDGFPARAAAVAGAYTDQAAMLDKAPQMRPVMEAIWLKAGEKMPQAIERRSALQWPELLNTPLLIQHGTADRSVDPEQALNLAMKLQKRGVEYQLTMYANDNHVLSRHREERDRQAIEWFRSHMRGASGTTEGPGR